MYLGFRHGELDNIEARPILLQDAPTSWLSAMLAEWLQWAPRDMRGSTSFATVENLKIALKQAGLGATAHEFGIPNMKIDPGMPCLLFCTQVHCIGRGLWSTVHV